MPKLFSDDVEVTLKDLGFSITDRGNIHLENNQKDGAYQGCNWWRLQYNFLDLSIYYDPSDSLGIVGEPYYELWDGDETRRFLATGKDENEFLSDITKMIKEHNTSVEEHPELWL